MKVIAQKNPSIALGAGFFQDFTQAAQEIISIPVVFKDSAALDASGHDVVQSPWRVYSGLSRHDQPVA